VATAGFASTTVTGATPICNGGSQHPSQIWVYDFVATTSDIVLASSGGRISPETLDGSASSYKTSSHSTLSYVGKPSLLARLVTTAFSFHHRRPLEIAEETKKLNRAPLTSSTTSKGASFCSGVNVCNCFVKPCEYCADDESDITIIARRTQDQRLVRQGRNQKMADLAAEDVKDRIEMASAER